MVISFEIYETSLRRVSYISYEMTSSVRFCLSYDRFKPDFIVFKVDRHYFNRKRIAVTDVVTALHVRAKMLCNVWSYDFMTWHYPLNNSDVI